MEGNAQRNILIAINEAEAMETLRDLRDAGWRVAVHNDYMKDGELHTFWLMTRGDFCVKGEGRTDYDALSIIASEASRVSQ